MRLEIRVDGDPEPQGSKVAMLVGWRSGQKHRPVIKLEESGNLERADGSRNNAKAWRLRVQTAAEKAREESGDDSFPFDGPCMLSCTFLVERPASHLKKDGGLRAGHESMFAASHSCGDLSKHVRAIEDALTDAGVWTDDARASEIHARKLYAPAGSRPGVRIVVESL